MQPRQSKLKILDNFPSLAFDPESSLRMATLKLNNINSINMKNSSKIEAAEDQDENDEFKFNKNDEDSNSDLDRLENNDQDATDNLDNNEGKPQIWNINESSELIELRKEIKEIVDQCCEGNENCQQSQLTKINFECRKLKYNFVKPSILSYMLLDLKHEGKVPTVDVVEWMIDNIIVESNLIDDIEERYQCMPSNEEVTHFARNEVNRIIDQRKEIFMELIFDSMQSKSSTKV